MSKLTTLRKKITQLEAEYARAAKLEMDAAVEKVKELMASLGVTLEHLGLPPSSASSKKVRQQSAPTKKATLKRTGAGIPKYKDPKSGKTWTGFGRAPGWIADVKNRDVFLVGKSTAASTPKADVTVAKKVKARKIKAPPLAKIASTSAVMGTVKAKAGAPKKTSASKKTLIKAVAAKKPAKGGLAPKKVAKRKPAASSTPESTGGSASGVVVAST